MRYFIILGMMVTSHLALGATADEILKRSDDIRSPADGFKMEVEVKNSDESIYRYQVDMGGKNRSLIKTLAPRRERGKNFLMIEEDIWAFIPNIHRSVRVALNQKMTGQIANGDICRVKWHGNYKATLKKEDAQSWVLRLTALKRGLTYDAIDLWVQKGNYHPMKAHFLTRAGRVLKTAQFGGFKQIAGDLRPTEIVVRHADDQDEFSVVKVSAMKKMTFSDAHFTRQNLD